MTETNTFRRTTYSNPDKFYSLMTVVVDVSTAKIACVYSIEGISSRKCLFSCDCHYRRHSLFLVIVFALSTIRGLKTSLKTTNNKKILLI